MRGIRNGNLNYVLVLAIVLLAIFAEAGILVIVLLHKETYSGENMVAIHYLLGAIAPIWVTLFSVLFHRTNTPGDPRRQFESNEDRPPQ